MPTIKALTICQPWAWAIAAGHKRVENRTWSTPYRGPLAIHAGKSQAWLDEGHEFLYGLGLAVPAHLDFGAIVAVAELVDVTLYAKPKQPTDRPHKLDDDPFAFGPYCWVLDNVQRLPEPIEYRGAQSLWELRTDELPDLVPAALAAQ